MRFLFLTAFVIFAALVQNTNFLVIAGIKPNLVLTNLIAASFFIESFWFYSLLLFFGVFLLQNMPGLNREILTLAGLLLSVFWLKKISPWQPLAASLIFIVGATALFYVFGGLTSALLPVLIWEIIYNVIVGAVIYLILREICSE